MPFSLEMPNVVYSYNTILFSTKNNESIHVTAQESLENILGKKPGTKASV